MAQNGRPPKRVCVEHAYETENYFVDPACVEPRDGMRTAKDLDKQDVPNSIQQLPRPGLNDRDPRHEDGYRPHLLYPECGMSVMYNSSTAFPSESTGTNDFYSNSEATLLHTSEEVSLNPREMFLNAEPLPNAYHTKQHTAYHMSHERCQTSTTNTFITQNTTSIQYSGGQWNESIPHSASISPVPSDLQTKPDSKMRCSAEVPAEHICYGMVFILLIG